MKQPKSSDLKLDEKGTADIREAMSKIHDTELSLNTEPLKQIEELEVELHKKETRKNVSRLKELLSQDFIEFGTSGKVSFSRHGLHFIPET